MIHVVFCVLLVCFFARPVFAIEKINSPNVIEGRLQLEQLSIRTSDDRKALNNAQRHRWEASYGFTDRIDIALDAAVSRRSGQELEASAIGIRPRYQVTRQDEAGWWLASAIQAKYTASLNGGNDDLAFRLLLQRRQGPLVAVVNIGMERELGAGRTASMDLRGGAQVIYETSLYLSPGFEYFTGYGPVNDRTPFTDQPHEIGPIITGDIPIHKTAGFAYVAGYYWGLTDEAPDSGARLQLNYVQQF